MGFKALTQDNINDLTGMFKKECLNLKQLSKYWATQIHGYVDRGDLFRRLVSCSTSQITSQK